MKLQYIISKIVVCKLSSCSSCFKGGFTPYWFVSAFSVFLHHEELCVFGPYFCKYYVHIGTNQPVTYKTKVFRKIFFVKGYIFILKHLSHRSYLKFLNKIFINTLQPTLCGGCGLIKMRTKCALFFTEKQKRTKTYKNGRKEDTVFRL